MIESDKDIDAAWRAASREEPPRALDDAIRAAARREVASGPRRGRNACVVAAGSRGDRRVRGHRHRGNDAARASVP
jgi:hypothetical protein